MKQVDLAQARKSLGLTHKEVAQKVGISRCFYTQIEKGTRKPSLAVALKISNVLGIPVNEIFSESGEAQPTGTEGASK